MRIITNDNFRLIKVNEMQMHEMQMQMHTVQRLDSIKPSPAARHVAEWYGVYTVLYLQSTRLSTNGMSHPAFIS